MGYASLRIRSVAAMIMTVLFLMETSDGFQSEFRFDQDDHVCYIGNTMADRMQHHAWLETYIHSLFPNHQLTFRNLGFAADEVKTRPRSDNFGSPDQWLSKCKADVVFCFFGYNEALRGPDGLGQFKKDLAQAIDNMRSQNYNDDSAPELVFFSPIAHENLNSPHLPDGTKNNNNLKIYTDAMKVICEQKQVRFIDLFIPSLDLYDRLEEPMTINGIHLSESGNRRIAQHVIETLFPEMQLKNDSSEAKLREAVLDKNYHWFSRYRVVDGYNVFGGRSKLAWFGQSNADVMVREMEIFDVMTANRDKRVWAVAQGGDLVVKDDNLPQELAVETNKKGPLEGGAFPYLGAEEAMDKMTIHQGMKVNVFASEEMFPRLINPVQMAVDTDSRLWASVWESYPHWNPTQKRKDAIVILPDENGDGVADQCKIFADELNSITGFEFWNGGLLVAAPPELWYLKDSDGDDVADVKIRVLQGISSADTHHSANAMLIGPDGWLYWSRGIFNVANFETPTKTYRSGRSGVHRFNPRTYEVEFHFPIGPNPHGDVFDRWGYQFANDGTGGTGSYINIGKGIGNKQWFKKRVRPVPANGILSSSHFPTEHEGNFLISNAIGFLGVLQHEVSYNGADITCTEIEPIVYSSDPNFRPSDMEIGGDGALYIADWHNSLIGHMQHNMRDPNRDHTHGRVYRVTYEGRDLLTPAKMKGKPIAEVCENFFALENGTRYRARLELTSRSPDEIRQKVGAFAAKLNPKNAARSRDEAQALLECLWVFEEQRIPNLDLLKKTFQADEPRVRAAAIRTLGHWAGHVSGWEELLQLAAKDESALVRAEAVKAAVDFQGRVAAEVIFEAATRPADPEMKTVLNYAKSQIRVDALVKDALRSGAKLSDAALNYVLVTGSVNDLLQLEPTANVYPAILSREQATTPQLSNALTGLAKSTSKQPINLLMDLTDDALLRNGNISGLGKLLAAQPIESLARIQNRIKNLALDGANSDVKRLGYAAWIAAAGPSDAFLAASKDKDRLRDFLDAIPSVNEKARRSLYAKVEPLIFELPSGMPAEHSGGGLQETGIEVDYFFPNGKNAKLETINAMEPISSQIVEKFGIYVPKGRSRDTFALRFRGLIHVPRSGQYTFFTNSDDGSMLYIDDKEVVNNDGSHAMREKSGRVELTAGAHSIVVNYFDSGGGDGLVVSWQGPGIKKQPIPGDRLSIGGGETLHDVAIRALSSIPGSDDEKFKSLTKLIALGRNRSSAVKAITKLPESAWDSDTLGSLVDNIVGYISEMAPRQRTMAPAIEAIQLTNSLAEKLPMDQRTAVRERLKNLDVRVIAIGTVPHRMIYDKELIVVEAGKPVEFRFSNTDSMPHNFAITEPGSLAEVGELAEETSRAPDAMQRGYIPKSDKIMLASGLLQPGENESLSFTAPSEPGVYPYVCTYPGHWRRMYGALYVVQSFQGYHADPEVRGQSDS